MGDTRFDQPYRRLREGHDAMRATRAMTDDEVIQALAAASRQADPYLANVLATEAMNRMRRARAVFEFIGEGVCLLGPAGEVWEINPAGRRMLGWGPEDVAGSPSHEALHAEPSGACTICRAMETGKRETSETERFARKSGEPLPVSSIAAPLVLDDAMEGVVVAFRDNREHRTWMSLMSAIYDLHDQLGMGVVITDGQALAFANEAFCRIAGRTFAELKAMETLLDIVDPSSQAAMVEAFTWKGAPFPPRHLQSVLLTRDGRRVPVDLRVTVADGGPGAPPRYVCLAQSLAA